MDGPCASTRKRRLPSRQVHDPQKATTRQFGLVRRSHHGKDARFHRNRHTVRWGFKDYWELNGGEPMLGLPIGQEFVGPDGWTTQYFSEPYCSGSRTRMSSLARSDAKRLRAKT